MPTFKAKDLLINEAKTKIKKPTSDELIFGKYFSDHMFTVDYHAKLGWNRPLIKQTESIKIHPASSALHYAIEVFEGMKAFKDQNQCVRIFRAEDHLQRLLKSCERMCLPKFDASELLNCIIELVKMDQDWCPNDHGCALYIRPFVFSTEETLGIKPPTEAKVMVLTSPVGPYFSSESFSPVSLLADPSYIRAWPGGVGDIKSGGNYGPTIYLQRLANTKYNCDQILWLFQDEITECGTMNIFVFLKNENGENELVTPELNGMILPGITRKSVLEITRQWNDFKVSERSITMKELIKAREEKRLYEVFGTGTACVICPVKSILYKGNHIKICEDPGFFPIAKRLYKHITDIQYSVIPSEWMKTRIPKNYSSVFL